MPDLGISNLDDVLIDVRRITDVCDLPLLVDVDTGFGSSAFNIARTHALAHQGAAPARCTWKTRSAPSAAATGRARNWSPATRWCDRIKAAVDGRTDRLVRHHGAHRRARERGL